MNTNIQGDFQICISAPLMYQQPKRPYSRFFWALEFYLTTLFTCEYPKAKLKRCNQIGWKLLLNKCYCIYPGKLSRSYSAVLSKILWVLFHISILNTVCLKALFAYANNSWVSLRKIAHFSHYLRLFLCLLDV